MTDSTTNGKPVELRLLGELGLQGSGNGAADELAGQVKRLALLTHMALAPGLHRRESLVTLLWPEFDPTAGRRALRQSVYCLRKTLGRNVFRSRGSDEIGIDPDALWCDASALETAYAERDYETAAELFAGDLLPGFHLEDATPEFERALENARRRVRDKGLSALRHLAEEKIRAGESRAAARLARRALDLEPHDEASIRLLLRALDLCGDRAGAVRAYETFERRLRDDLEVEPSAETVAAILTVRERDEPREAPADAEPFPDTLPTPLTSLVGRSREIDLGLRLLDRPEVRFVTLTGPGGVGKTRLGLEIARRAAPRYPDGVVHAPLDAFADPDAALAAIVRATGAELRDERAAAATLRDRLRHRRALLVLDGMERIPGIGLPLTEILESAPGVDALLTSRRPIGLTAEHTLPVPTLSLPAPDRRLGGDLPLDSEAVALFLDRGRAVDPPFGVESHNVDAVIQIVRGLDGLPLAIELAASRLRHLPVEEIARRIGGDHDLLRDGAPDRPDRQKTIEAAIRWTSDRLDADERALFHGLGAFAGDFSLSAVEKIWPDVSGSGRSVVSVLSGLIDHGLVERPVTVEGETRYRLLRTIRDHASEALESSGRGDAWRRRLTAWYAEWTGRGFSHWCGPREEAWLAAIDRERLNLGAVLDWAVEREPARAAEIAAALYYYWWVRGQVREGRERIARILELGGDALEPSLRARLQVSLGKLDQLQGSDDEAVARVRRGVATYRKAGDRTGLGWALQSLGNALFCVGAFDDALDALQEAREIGRETNTELRIHTCGQMIAQIARERGDLERAEVLLKESLAHARRTGSRGEEGRIHLSLARIALDRDEAPLAERRAREALTIAEDLDDANETAFATRVLADAFRAQGRRGDAVHSSYARALELYRRIENEDGICAVLVALGEAGLGAGDPRPAARLLAGVANHVRASEVQDPTVASRLARAVDACRRRIGAEAFDREVVVTEGVPLDRLVEWAQDLVPTVEIRLAAP